MPAALARPSRNDPIDMLLQAATRRGTLDRKTLPVALLCAVCVHLAMLALPLPEREVVPPPVDPPPSSTELTPTPLPPPDILPPQFEHTAVERLQPVPFENRPVDVDPAETPLRPLVSNSFAPAYDLPLSDPVPPPAREIYTEGTSGLVLPVPLPGRVEPEYPRLGRTAGISGRVVLQAVIDETGRVVSVEVLAASRPDLGFSEAAIAAVSAWRYEPGRIGDRPVPVRMRVVVEFSLQ